MWICFNLPGIKYMVKKLWMKKHCNSYLIKLRVFGKTFWEKFFYHECLYSPRFRLWLVFLTLVLETYSFLWLKIYSIYTLYIKYKIYWIHTYYVYNLGIRTYVSSLTYIHFAHHLPSIVTFFFLWNVPVALDSLYIKHSLKQGKLQINKEANDFTSKEKQN